MTSELPESVVPEALHAPDSAVDATCAMVGLISLLKQGSWQLPLTFDPW